MTATEGERPIKITRGSIDSLTFYEVTDDELQILENGPSSSIYLNVAIALITLCLSFFTSIATVNFKTERTFDVFLIVAIVTLMGGIGFLIAWFMSKKSYTGIVKKIRARAEKEKTTVAVEEI